MFINCAKLKKLDLSKWNISSVTTMDKMFESCKSLKYLDLSNWEFGEIRTAYRVFLECKELNTIKITNWENLNFNKNMKKIFNDLTNKIPKFIDFYSGDVDEDIEYIEKVWVNLGLELPKDLKGKIAWAESISN